MIDSSGASLPLQVLRIAFFVLAVLFAVVALLDWLVRTRRINAFNPVARFFRRTVDPMLRPIERRVVASGGMPAHAPIWALVVIVVGAIIVLTVLDWLLGQIATLSVASGAGPRAILRLAVRWVFGFFVIALLVRVISSWVRVSPYSKWVYWSYRSTEWMIGPLRRVVPTIGMIDITPIVAYILLRIAQALVLSVI